MAASKKSIRKSREDWVQAAIVALGEGGVEAVRVEPLARALGVTKGSFYWHFADRGELLRALVDAWAHVGTEQIISSVNAHRGDAPSRLRQLWQLSTSGPLNNELALRDWARREPWVAEQIDRVDGRRLGFLRELFRELGHTGAELEGRCLLMYSLLIGDYFIAAKHGRFSRGRVLEAALEALLRDP